MAFFDDKKELDKILKETNTLMTPQEINEAVARKLGWVTRPCKVCKADTFFNPAEKVILLIGVLASLGDCKPFHGIIPDYCGSIAAAWEIVEYLRKKEISVIIEAWPMEFKKAYSCKLTAFAETPIFAEAHDAPMAICLAFLKLQ